MVRITVASLVSAIAVLAAVLPSAPGEPASLPGRPGLIAFTSVRGNSVSIYTIRPDGSDIRRVTQHGQEGSAAWSPDGRRIAFVGDAPPPNPAPEYNTFAIYVVNADGTNLQRVTPIPSGALSKPSWSPDGEKLAYSTGIDGEATIHVINLDGTGDVALTKPSLSAEGPGLVAERETDRVFRIAGWRAMADLPDAQGRLA